ncbi:IS21 family transposase [Alkalihalobacillus sp. AL-G]|uniref:IS21 family transposase n=1 Tax=Alkalihalobacillus sp. AL-G TaxID=2926399 RepID=UPI00272A3759|nr:IS21 family transposase [Alkalihalobacillus sp. AL-G]WLD93353.1 IS21 family transposase [Alkalihalobacillus sp. AL-G]WLD94630.1 IS21 family transposase [Alkalihalobacillus sp. AL-G]
MKLEGERRKVKELLERGMSQSDIAEMLGMHRHTVRALSEREKNHVQHRSKKGSKLDPYKDYLLKRIQEDYVFNCEKLIIEIKQRGYSGGSTILKEFVQPYRKAFKESHTRRYETEPGEQMQVDWKEAGHYQIDGEVIPLMIFVATLSYSRMSYACFAERQDREHLLYCLTNAFEYFGGVTEKVMFDNMKTIINRRSGPEVEWNEKFLDFVDHYAFKPSVHRPYRPQTKGKVERFIGYMNGWLETSSVRSLQELNLRLLRWVEETANQRIHSTTERKPVELWLKESLQPLNPSRYDSSYITYRKIGRDGVMNYHSRKILMSSKFAGQEVMIKETLDGTITVYYHGEAILTYTRDDKVLPLSEQIRKKQRSKAGTLHAAQDIEVAVRPLSVYDQFLQEGER